MKPVKYTKAQANKIDRGSKVIFKYPTPTKNYDLAHMVVSGRFPADGSYTLNNVCDFFIYVLRGTGTVYAGDEVYQVAPTDVVFVPAKNKYAVEGDFEYVTIDVPAFDNDQAQSVDN